MPRIQRMIAATLLAAFLTPIAQAQTGGQANGSCTDVNEDYECFQLFNECQPIDLVVEGLNQDAKNINLTKESIITTAEARLRSARIYDSSNPSYLYVNVNVSSSAFSIDIELNKIVMDFHTILRYPATTWSIGGTGVHGRNSSYIISSVAEYIDQFLVEFLRVNEQWCK